MATSTTSRVAGYSRPRALKNTLSGAWPRRRMNHSTGQYELETSTEAFTGVIVGARADEEGSRSKERYFSPRSDTNVRDVGHQPPELWNQYTTDFAPGTHVRIDPLLDWTELNIWEYIEREASRPCRCTTTRARARGIGRSAARRARAWFNRTRARCRISSWSFGATASRTPPNGRDAPRTRKTGAGSIRCGGRNICSVMLWVRGT